MELIRRFDRLGKNDASIAGGKGASLGEMTQAGIPVPPGFVILAGAFERFLEEADLNQELDAILATVKHDQIHTVEHASEKINGLILAADMPKDIAQEIQTEFKKLDAQYVAVRSSATAEDGAAAAWAGQLDTFLNTTEGHLLENVQRCWASLFTPRAIFYRFEKGMHGQGISVAVVVQKMVQSEVSGIAFSVHPVTEDHNQLIIEAGFGLGEAIVSGQVTPDSYVVEKEPRRIIDTNISTQTRGLYRGGKEGNEWKDIPEPKASSQVLSSEQVLELSELILKIEKHYGFPCDIEWAFEKGKFYITQSRPITTLSDIESPKKLNPDPNKDWLVLNSGAVPYIIGYSMVQWTTGAHGTYPEYAPMSQCGLRFMKAGSEAQFLVDRTEYETSFKKLIESPAVLECIYADFENGEKQFLAFERAASQDPSYLEAHFSEFLKAYDAMYIPGIIVDGALVYGEVFCEEMKRKYPGKEQEIQILVTPHGESFLGRYRKALLVVASHGKPTAADGDALQKSFHWIHNNYKKVTPIPVDTFLREVEEIAADQSINIEEELRAADAEIARHRDQCESIKKSTPFSAADYEKLWWIGQIAWWVDRRKEYNIKANYYLGQHLTTISTQHGLSYDDAAFLLPWELDMVVAGDRKITEFPLEERKNGGIYFHDITGVGKFMVGADAIRFWNALLRKTTNDSHELRGSVAYKGIVQGKVRIIMDAHAGIPFDEGDILVTGMTRPEFVPLMKKARGIVTDEGGVTSHAAIMSRELKKPCIIGTKIATQVLKDGDMVEVDAEQGVVRLLESGAGSALVKQLSGIEWYQDWSGLYSHLEASLDEDAYFGIFERTSGVRFSRALITFSGDTAAGWLPTADAEMIGTHLVGRMKDPKFLQGWVSAYRAHADTLMPFFKLPPEAFLAQFKEYVGLYPLLAPYVIGTKIAFNMLPLGSETIARELEAARTYTENFYKDSSIAITALCEFIAERSGYPTNLTRTLTTDDVCAYAATGKLPEQAALEERFSRGGMLFSSGSQQVLSKAEVENVFSSFHPVAANGVLRGTSAYNGNVKGVCRVVVDYRNAILNEGEILVTPMTNPYFVPLMKKAAAIVTDGGGMLSHAAIVARELMKPCVIGTRFATQILKDGDEIEVDADNGVVRILKKAHP